MKSLSTFSFAMIVIIAASFFFPQNSYAYIDPGTGSYIIQMIIAFAVGAAFAVKLFWIKLKLFFINLFSKPEKNEEIIEDGK